MNYSRVLFGGLIIVMLVGAGYFVYRNYLAPQPEATAQVESTPSPANDADGTISSEGRVEPASYVELGFAQVGKVAEVLVKEGDMVKTGDRLAVLDTSILEATLQQAEAALQSAQANLQAAQTQQEQVLISAHAAEANDRSSAWNEHLPEVVEQPTWYFTRTEEISSTQTEIENALQELTIAQEALQVVMERASGANLLNAEKRLSDAQAAFLVANDVLNQARSSGNEDLWSEAHSDYDAARSKLQDAQDYYDDILDSEGTADVLDARAGVAVAQERYDSAQDRLNSLLTGDQSLEVRLAEEDVQRAQAAVTEAEAAKAAAQAALDEAALIAPSDGTIARVDMKAGQAVSPGITTVVLADMTSWVIRTNDLAESDVALLQPGESVNVSLDAFPTETFHGTVQSISLWSEDNRGSVTYQVLVSFDPQETPVRWGMTAFVDIDNGNP